MRAYVAPLALAALAACSTPRAGPDPEPAARPPAGTCNAAGVQGLVGQRATAELGARLLRETGAATLRWGPPRSAMTMDYRVDRLTVSYGDDMLIERISCG